MAIISNSGQDRLSAKERARIEMEVSESMPDQEKERAFLMQTYGTTDWGEIEKWYEDHPEKPLTAYDKMTIIRTVSRLKKDQEFELKRLLDKYGTTDWGEIEKWYEGHPDEV